MANLRIIIDPPDSASFNMAADLFLFNKCKRNSEDIYLRLYKWKFPTITLGCMQNEKTLCEKNTLKNDGISVIKRFTGGRAVLHWDDLTYSFIFSQNHTFLGTSINSTYDIISTALSGALKSLGIKPLKHSFSSSGEASRSQIKLPCFLSPNKNEIIINNKKLIGSAQKRGNKSVLQHGSVPLNGNFRKITDYLYLNSKTKCIIQNELLKNAISLNEIIELPSEEKINNAFIEGFENSLPVKVYKKNWSRVEKESIMELANSISFKEKWLFE